VGIVHLDIVLTEVLRRFPMTDTRHQVGQNVPPRANARNCARAMVAARRVEGGAREGRCFPPMNPTDAGPDSAHLLPGGQRCRHARERLGLAHRNERGKWTALSPARLSQMLWGGASHMPCEQ
jgi:hypothetical protein